MCRYRRLYAVIWYLQVLLSPPTENWKPSDVITRNREPMFAARRCALTATGLPLTAIDRRGGAEDRAEARSRYVAAARSQKGGDTARLFCVIARRQMRMRSAVRDAAHATAPRIMLFPQQRAEVQNGARCHSMARKSLPRNRGHDTRWKNSQVPPKKRRPHASQTTTLRRRYRA